jgi:hypothetical protein
MILKLVREENRIKMNILKGKIKIIIEIKYKFDFY